MVHIFYYTPPKAFLTLPLTHSENPGVGRTGHSNQNRKAFGRLPLPLGRMTQSSFRGQNPNNPFMESGSGFSVEPDSKPLYLVKYVKVHLVDGCFGIGV